VSSIERAPQVSGAGVAHGPQGATFAVLAAAAIVLSGVALWVGLSGTGEDLRVLGAIAHALIIAAPIGAGLYALRTQSEPNDRFGWTLVAVGLLSSPTLLAESGDSALYSVGRVAGWCAEVMLLYLVLSYPWGRLRTRMDRVLCGAALAAVAVFYLPTVLLAEYFPEPSPWATCGTDCPPNAFMVAGSEPGFVHAFLWPVGQAVTATLYVVVALALARRLTRGGRLTRIALAPLVGVALIRMVVAAAFVIARTSDADSQAAEVLSVVGLLCAPAFSLAFLAGLARSRRVAARRLSRLGVGFGSRPGREELRDAIAEAVDDPSLEIFYWNSEDPAGWVDTTGEPVALPSASADRRLTEVRGNQGRVAVLVHDAGLEQAPVVSDLARGYALMALENQRLETQLRASLRELRASRLRILSAADRERRRIERDLHDGAQQRLVGLGIQLELAGDLVELHPDRAAKRLRELARDVDDAVDEVRTLAHGLVPPLLVERGLPDALRDAAMGGPLPATVNAPALGRYGQEIESAVYFCCLEALQNAAKHAKGARSVKVTLWEEEELCFDVRDDGAGLPEGTVLTGVGLTNMRDRIGAVGGRLTIGSAPGEGTWVTGSVPVVPIDLPPQVEKLLQRATDALEESFAIYRAVRDERGVVADFLVEHVNKPASDEMHRSREELVGRRLGELDPAWLDSADFRWLRRVLEGGRSDSRPAVVYEHVRGEGRLIRRASEMRAAPIGSGRVVLTWRDVTEQALRDERLRLQSLVLANEGDGVCVVRASDAAIVYANPHFASLLGFEPGELDGSPLAAVDGSNRTDESARLMRAMSAAVAAGGEARLEVVNKRKDGGAVRSEVRVAEFDHPDHGRVLVSVHRELSRRGPSARRAVLHPEPTQLG
jgi:signal transduction histidine kinase